MEPRIQSLTIERFRALRKLEIDGLGRVNLITGRNNTGKSSVLEALRILASYASPSVIYDILRFREEDTDEMDDVVRPVDTEGAFLWSSLFHGFPQFSDNPEPFVIRSTGSQRTMELSVATILAATEQMSDGSRRLTPTQPGLFDGADGIPALQVRVGEMERLYSLKHLQDYAFRSRPYRLGLQEAPRLTCVPVSPFGGEKTATLGNLWDIIALSDREKEVVEALRIIDPDIEAVSMVGGERPRSARTAIVRSKALPRPVPLRSFGDGLNRLFGIILSLVNAKDGLLLIDEFENGMHYSVQPDAWRVIFKLARRLDIQVVATSHSWDAIEAFQKAASEDPEDGVLIRLSRKGDDIVSTVFREDELAIATRDGIEVR